MKCSNCFHYNACGNASPYNDPSMCKLYVDRVLHGDALKIVSDEMDRLTHRVKELEVELKAAEFENKDLEDEVKLLRIIKQTLEMQSGMKFDI